MKHGNKHWEREKEYYSLLKEYEYLHITISVYNWNGNSKVDAVRKKFKNKYYNEYYGTYNSYHLYAQLHGISTIDETIII